jgi:hypothetical protein
LARAALIAALLALLALFVPANSLAALQFAGLVVRHDDERLSYAYVGFTEAEINGVELLRRSGLDIVTIAFGGLGEGVCSIEATGCPASDCRRRVCQGPDDESPFWQYFRQVAPGEWKALALGASSTKVRHGDVDGWSWTPREPGLPPLSLESVAQLAGFEGGAFAGRAPDEPGTALRRATPLAEEDKQSTAAYVGGAAVLVVAAGAVGYVAWRRRGTGAAG